VDIKEFAAHYRLQVRRDVDGTDIISAKFGHLYEHSALTLGLLFMPSAPRARLWSVVKAKATAAGMTVRQNGDTEGTLLFNPASPEQASLAIRLVRARQKRILTVEQRSALAERLHRKGTSAARNVEERAA
jgi:hypothetical protein